jgi:hypothetical protein
MIMIAHTVVFRAVLRRIFGHKREEILAHRPWVTRDVFKAQKSVVGLQVRIGTGFSGLNLCSRRYQEDGNNYTMKSRFLYRRTTRDVDRHIRSDFIECVVGQPVYCDVQTHS